MFLPRASDGALTPVMPDFVRDALAQCHAQVSDYRVVQRAPDRIEMCLEGADPMAARSAAEAALARVFDRAGVAHPAIELGGPIERDLGRKLRRVRRDFPFAFPPISGEHR